MIPSINHHKIVNKTSLFLFLFLLTILSFESNLTVAKYEEEGQEVLKYQSTIALTESGKEKLSLLSMNEKEVVAEVWIPRDHTNVKESETSTYKLLLPDACVIRNSEDIIFSDGEEEKQVEFSCDLEDSNLVVEKEGEDFLELSVKVLESINSEMYFLYKEYDYSEKVEPVTVAATEEDEKSMLQFRESLIQNILHNAYYRSYEKEITAYIADASDPIHLPGLQIDYQEYYQYTYVIEDSFIGYARTYYENKDKEEKNTMYFTENDPVAIDEMFSYYLEEYFCKSDNNQYYMMMNYISSTEKISDVILNGKNIPGISYQAGERKMTIERDILSYLDALINDDTTVIYQANEEQQKGTFLASILQNSTVSSSMKQEIIGSNEVIDAVIQNKSDGADVIDYVEVDDGYEFVIIEVSRGDNYNTITILPVSVVEDPSYYQISIDCSRLNLQNVDILSLINLMSSSLAAEKETEDYQINGNLVSFQLKKIEKESPPPSSAAAISSYDEETPPPSSNSDQLEESIDSSLEESSEKLE